MENKTEKISYMELARRVGDTILNNNIMPQVEGWELENGKEDYCYIHKTEEECQKDSGKCEYEMVEIYQTYIITENGADYLKRNTSEIIYYNDDLNMYIWGITHFGTGWDGVFTNIKA